MGVGYKLSTMVERDTLQAAVALQFVDDVTGAPILPLVLPVEDTRELALSLLEAAEAASIDAFLVPALRSFKLDEETIADVLMAVRTYRMNEEEGINEIR